MPCKGLIINSPITLMLRGSKRKAVEPSFKHQCRKCGGHHTAEAQIIPYKTNEEQHTPKDDKRENF